MLLAGCSSKVDEAERRYEIVKRSRANAADVCGAGRAVKDAYLAAGRADVYRDRVPLIDAECFNRTSEDNRGEFRNDDGSVMSADQQAAAIEAVENAMNYADQKIHERELHNDTDADE